MPFNHNDRYHPRLVRLVPPGARTALDVGCGSGRFARRLAAHGLDVEGIDPSAEMIGIATATGSPGPGTVTYRHEDVTTAELPQRRYDVITCLASLHHVPFETVTRLRTALAPGGVLAVLGLATPSTAADHATWLGAAPVNVAARLLVHVGERLNGGADDEPRAPVRDWIMSMADVRTEAARLLPGSTVRTLLFWRYLLSYRSV
ncbi:class I SAM-dependent methyltransferase [Prauserella cavernicola]|uniref:Class I SAM-dependent methyltransferase n=1 Tax=Prauserella cavernicola TaxID=2800127 RepID=A0A934QVL3_9PSEU|nr:class I SAM-dependent methyltransferase [Prauserella cavernicola]MBK1786424.1 class I SAM-dependent methyltransferase [Prauserella cavernicola]